MANIQYTTIKKNDFGSGTISEFGNFYNLTPPEILCTVSSGGFFMANALDLVGKKIGMLEVLERVGNRKNAAQFKVKCECGTEKIVVGSELSRWRHKSCGECYKAKNGTNTPYKDGKYATINAVYGEYRSSARKRNLTFELHIEDFEQLITGNCYFCDSSPSIFRNKYLRKDGELHPQAKTHGVRKERIANAGMYITGIDRVDSSLGYVKENCISCCWVCNRAKGTLSLSEFLTWLRLVGKKYG